MKKVKHVILQNNAPAFNDLMIYKNMKSLSISVRHVKNKYSLKNLLNIEKLVIHELYGGESINYEHIKYLTNLKELDVSRNSCINDKDIINLTQLQSINIHASDITLNSLIKFKNLTRLDILYDRPMYNDDNTLQFLTNLKTLKVNSYGIYYPEHISSLTALSSLCVGSEICGDFISKLTNLTYLNTCNSNITCENIKNLSKLNTLIISNGSSIHNIHTLTNLTELQVLKKIWA